MSGADVRLLHCCTRRQCNAMFNLFRKKMKPKRPFGRSSLKQSSPLQVELGRSDPPSFEGYTIQEMDVSQVAHSLQSADLTPEQLIRWEDVLTEKKP